MGNFTGLMHVIVVGRCSRVVITLWVCCLIRLPERFPQYLAIGTCLQNAKTSSVTSMLAEVNDCN